MNVMIDGYKQMARMASILLKNGGNPSRKYATSIADYKITWVEPKKVPYWSSERSGDQGIKIDVKSSNFGNSYNELSELKDANDTVKKMFTLQFLPRKETTIIRREKIMALVKRHKLDDKSSEAKIAKMTSDIYQLQKDVLKQPTNKVIRIKLLETIDKRKKILKLLREKDYRRFEWVLEKLNLVYKPTPELPLKINRETSLERLTEKHCNELVQEKLDAYKTELKQLQKDFYIEKMKKLMFIREEELACGLQPSVSEEDIAYAKQKANEYQT
ncbi:hypothetical protein PUN28_008999 [Cardiocondyla obscurior]|uniref:Small ribosomal subunit protein uS15m n=1 Tax=Cardiocondyla obscurior TaxID=286306 RepID=A0AAW2FSB5_9HYME